MKSKIAKKTPQHVLEKMARGKLAEFEQRSDELYDLARATYDAQDTDTREAIDRIHDATTRMFRQQAYVARTRTGERMPIEFSREVHSKLSFYIAVEIVKDLGIMDIRVANFKFTKACVVCGKKVKK